MDAEKCTHQNVAMICLDCSTAHAPKGAAPTPGGVEAAARAAVKAYNEWCRSRASWMDDWMDAMAKLEEELSAPSQGSPQEGKVLDLDALELFVSRAMSEDDWSFDVAKEGKKCLEMFARWRTGRPA